MWSRTGTGQWAKFFRKIGALRRSSERFRQLIEARTSPDGRPDATSQRSFVAAANSTLAETGQMEFPHSNQPMCRFSAPRSYAREPIVGTAADLTEVLDGAT
ncbi:MAG: hypothetical protein F4X05_11620 [Rhodothermaceae bacterium]|nr:hypothetical protein [Rhodothermaceae bacterium]